MSVSPDFAKLEGLEQAVRQAPADTPEFWNTCRMATVFVRAEAEKDEDAIVWGASVESQMLQLEKRTYLLNQEGNLRPEEARNQALGALRLLRALWEGAAGPG